MYKLFLDDLKNPQDIYTCFKNPIYLEDWIIVRTYQQFQTAVTKFGVPDIVSFDNDISDFDENNNEKTGYDCVKWLCNYCQDRSIKFPRWFIHSENNVGTVNINSYILNYIKNVEV